MHMNTVFLGPCRCLLQRILDVSELGAATSLDICFRQLLRLGAFIGREGRRQNFMGGSLGHGLRGLLSEVELRVA